MIHCAALIIIRIGDANCTQIIWNIWGEIVYEGINRPIQKIVQVKNIVILVILPITQLYKPNCRTFILNENMLDLSIINSKNMKEFQENNLTECGNKKSNKKCILQIAG